MIVVPIQGATGGWSIKTPVDLDEMEFLLCFRDGSVLLNPCSVVQTAAWFL